MDTCANCGRTIGQLEKAHVIDQHVVCYDCWKKLKEQAEDKAFNAAEFKARQRTKELIEQLQLPQVQAEWVVERAAQLETIILSVPWTETLLRGRRDPKVATAIFAVLMIRMEERIKAGT